MSEEVEIKVRVPLAIVVIENLDNGELQAYMTDLEGKLVVRLPIGKYRAYPIKGCYYGDPVDFEVPKDKVIEIKMKYICEVCLNPFSTNLPIKMRVSKSHLSNLPVKSRVSNSYTTDLPIVIRIGFGFSTVV